MDDCCFAALVNAVVKTTISDDTIPIDVVNDVFEGVIFVMDWVAFAEKDTNGSTIDGVMNGTTFVVCAIVGDAKILLEAETEEVAVISSTAETVAVVTIVVFDVYDGVIFVIDCVALAEKDTDVPTIDGVTNGTTFVVCAIVGDAKIVFEADTEDVAVINSTAVAVVTTVVFDADNVNDGDTE